MKNEIDREKDRLPQEDRAKIDAEKAKQKAVTVVFSLGAGIFLFLVAWIAAVQHDASDPLAIAIQASFLPAVMACLFGAIHYHNTTREPEDKK